MHASLISRGGHTAGPQPQMPARQVRQLLQLERVVPYREGRGGEGESS